MICSFWVTRIQLLFCCYAVFQRLGQLHSCILSVAKHENGDLNARLKNETNLFIRIGVAKVLERGGGGQA